MVSGYNINDWKECTNIEIVFQLKSLMKSLHLLVKKRRVPVPYPGLVKISISMKFLKEAPSTPNIGVTRYTKP